MDALLKATNFAGGISTGGGDNGSDVIPMPSRVGVRLSSLKLSGSVTIPANTYVTEVGILPMKDGGSSVSGKYTAPTAGTVVIGTAAAPARYMASRAATAIYEGAAATAEVVDAETQIDFVATGLNGDVIVFVEVTPLAQRT